jgi:hypothetical protein
MFPAQQHIADYLKDLADREMEDWKLIIVGIPRTGQRLVDRVGRLNALLYLVQPFRAERISSRPSQTSRPSRVSAS